MYFFQFENMVSFDVLNVIDDHFMEELGSKVRSAYGEVRFMKFIHEMIWVAFVHNEQALEMAKGGPIQVCGHDLTVHLKVHTVQRQKVSGPDLIFHLVCY